MKVFLTTILTLAIAFASQAQRFEVDDHTKNYKVRIGEKIATPIKIKNTSDQDIDLVIRRVEQQIGSSQLSFFCWDGECFETEQEQLPVQYKIPAGETSLKFETVLEAGLAAGLSTVKYLIYERNKPAQAIEYQVSYTIEDHKERSLIYDSEDLKINDVYPNPVSEFAIVDYDVVNREIDAKILIHNVLGSVVGEYKLPPLENKVTIKTEDFNPGVYFYTLYIDNDGIMTKKLIVRK